MNILILINIERKQKLNYKSRIQLSKILPDKLTIIY